MKYDEDIRKEMHTEFNFKLISDIFISVSFIISFIISSFVLIHAIIHLTIYAKAVQCIYNIIMQKIVKSFSQSSHQTPEWGKMQSL